MKQFMKNRKAIAFVLLIAMMFSIMPTAVWAETTDNNPDTTTAYVTIVDQGEIVMAHQKVTVTTSSAIIDDFLREAHNDAYIGGVEAGYNSYTGEYGLSLGKLWGDTSGAFGYRVNDASAWSLADSVKDGDHVVAFIYSDQSGWSDIYSYFDTHQLTVSTSSAVTLNLRYAGYDENWSPVENSLAYGEIYINGENSYNTTDAAGYVTLPSMEEGTYIISAKPSSYSGMLIVPPVCEVNVVENYVPDSDEADLTAYINQLEKSIELPKENKPFSFITYLEEQLAEGYSVNSVIESTNSAAIGYAGNIFYGANEAESDVTVSLRKNSISKNVTFRVTVPASNSLVENNSTIDSGLLEGIAKNYVNDTSEWVVMDMAAYKQLNSKTSYKTSDIAKQTYLNNAIEIVSKEIEYVGSTNPAKDTSYSKTIIALTALGIDVEQLYTANSNKSVNAITKLNKVEHSGSAWCAPYTLAAYQQGEYGTTAQETALIEAVLANQLADGSWNEWGDSIQTTSNVIAGLAFYYGDNENVKKAVDKAISYLSSQQKNDGSFDAYGSGPDANTAAMVVIALSSVGINPETDSRFIKNNVSALDNLLQFALEDNSGFGYTDNKEKNSSATEQGFRALIAASQVMKTGEAFNIYDFSSNTLEPGRATGSGAVQKPSTPSGSIDVTVTVSIKGLDGYWLKDKKVILKDDATMYWALVGAIDGTDLTQTGAENGYVSAISNGTKTLEEFDYGRNSGWLYKVNNTLPEVGLLEYVVKNGDVIEWYYTRDWTTDSLAGARVDNADKQAAAKVDALLDKLLDKVGSLDDITAEDAETIAEIRKAYDALTDEQKALVKGYDDLVAAEAMLEALLAGPEELPFTDTENHWAAGAIQYVYENGLLRGVSDTEFAPDATFSRAMLVTVLHRLAGSPASSGYYPFTDVRDTAWYANPVAWAHQNKLAGGMAETQYAPNSPITREQLAVMLMRYAQYQGCDTSDTIRLVHYKDAGQVSGYAETAVKWAVSTGILKGRTANELQPQGTATRAEVAVILQRFIAMYEPVATSDMQ